MGCYFFLLLTHPLLNGETAITVLISFSFGSYALGSNYSGSGTISQMYHAVVLNPSYLVYCCILVFTWFLNNLIRLLLLFHRFNRLCCASFLSLSLAILSRLFGLVQDQLVLGYSVVVIVQQTKQLTDSLHGL